jgi:hypothetical protein
MWHVLHLISRPIEVLLGLFCVLTAIVLYPDEEGKIQSKFEDVWVRVDDYQILALSRHTAFMTQVAKLETSFLNRVFGTDLISRQALTFSFWFSIVSFVFAGTYLRRLIHYQVLLPPFLIGFFIGLSLASIAYIFLSDRPVARDMLIWVGWVIAGGAVFQFLLTSTPTAAESVGTIFFFLLIGGFCFDALFIVFTRQLLELAGGMARSRRVVAILIVDFLLAVALVGPAFFWTNERFIHLVKGRTIVAASVATVAMSNMFDAALSLLFVLLAVVLLVHRAVWPLLTRTLFRIADIGTKGRRAILTTVGIALLGTSVFGGKFPELVAKLIEKFGG